MYSLESATQTANRVVELLAPHCERIHIAGSIRRKKESCIGVYYCTSEKRCISSFFQYN